MNSEKPPTLEVRILSGLHAGAACRLEQGALLGALVDCDIVLSDPGVPPVAGQLRADARGWRLEQADAQLDDAGSGTDGIDDWHAFGSPLEIGSGPVWITVAEAGAPWTQPDQRGEAGPTWQAPHTAADSHNRTVTGDVSLAPPHRARSGFVVAAICLFAAVAAAASLALWIQSDSPPAADLAPQQTPLTLARALIARAEPMGGVRAIEAKDGTVHIIGWVETDAEVERIRSALMALHPAPQFQVESAPRLDMVTMDALRSVPLRYEAKYLGDGHVAVVGISPDESGRAAALAAAEARLPGVRFTGDKIMLAAEVEQELTVALRQAGFKAPALSWQDGQLVVQLGELTPDERTRAQVEVAQFNTTRFNIAALAPSPPVATPAKPKLPFTVRSVVGGDQPWIIVDDGTKILVGGTYDGLRLTAVTNDSLTFEDSKSAVIAVPR